MYVITGATGNTGSVVAERLLKAGQKVRVVGRDPKRLEKFTEKGAESFIADATDARRSHERVCRRKGRVRDDPSQYWCPGRSRIHGECERRLTLRDWEKRDKVCRRFEQRRRGQIAWNRSGGRLAQSRKETRRNSRVKCPLPASRATSWRTFCPRPM